MTLSVKDGVLIRELHPAMVVALPTIMQAFRRYGLDTTITEGNDTINRKHRSFHKTIPLQALDFRTWVSATDPTQIDNEMKEALCYDMRVELGADYDVVWGRFNIHVEYDPK